MAAEEKKTFPTGLFSGLFAGTPQANDNLAAVSQFLLGFGQGTTQANQAGLSPFSSLAFGFGAGGQGLQQQQLLKERKATRALQNQILQNQLAQAEQAQKDRFQIAGLGRRLGGAPANEAFDAGVKPIAGGALNAPVSAAPGVNPIVAELLRSGNPGMINAGIGSMLGQQNKLPLDIRIRQAEAAITASGEGAETSNLTQKRLQQQIAAGVPLKPLQTESVRFEDGTERTFDTSTKAGRNAFLNAIKPKTEGGGGGVTFTRQEQKERQETRALQNQILQGQLNATAQKQAREQQLRGLFQRAQGTPGETFLTDPGQEATTPGQAPLPFEETVRQAVAIDPNLSFLALLKPKTAPSTFRPLTAKEVSDRGLRKGTVAEIDQFNNVSILQSPFKPPAPKLPTGRTVQIGSEFKTYDVSTPLGAAAYRNAIASKEKGGLGGVETPVRVEKAGPVNPAAVEFKEFRAGAAQTQQALNIADSLITLVRDNPQALGAPGAISRSISSLSSQAVNIFKLVTGEEPTAKPADFYSSEEEFARITGNAIDNAVIRSNIVQLAYAQAAAVGETSGRLSDRDVKEFMKIIGAPSGNATDPKPFIATLKDVAKRARDNFQTRKRILVQFSPNAPDALKNFELEIPEGLRDGGGSGTSTIPTSGIKVLKNGQIVRQ